MHMSFDDAQKYAGVGKKSKWILNAVLILWKDANILILV